MVTPGTRRASLMAEAEAAVNEGRLVRTLQELIRLPSENPLGASPSETDGEEPVARYLDERLRTLGASTELRPLGHRRFNVVGRLGSGETGASLMLAGHMDTARTAGYPGAYSAEVRNGRVYGRGACDMKGALACFLEVVEVLRALGVSLKGRLFVAGVADEEYRMVGAMDIGRHGPRVDGIIIGEPTELQVCVAARGRVSTFIVTRGRAAHSSVPETGINAIAHMGRILCQLEGYAEHLLRHPSPHPLLGAPRFNPGVITGGVQVNMVPDECRLEVDRRTLPGETVESVYAELESWLRALEPQVPGLRWELTQPTWLVPAYELAPNHPLARSLRRSLAAVRGTDPGVRGFPAGSDAAHFGSPAVICGPGSLRQAHSSDEWVSIPELVEATRVYLRTTLQLLA